MFSYEHQRTNGEKQVTNKADIFGSVRTKLLQALKMLQQVLHMFLRGRRGTMKDAFRSGMSSINRTDVRVSKAGGVRQSLFEWSQVSCRLKKYCLQDYHLRFIWKVMRLAVLKIWQFLVEGIVAILKQTPYSPDLALCDCSFPKAQGVIKRTCFEGVKAIKTAVMKEMMEHPRRILPAVHRKWQRKIEKSIRLDEKYFEGETM